MNNIKNSPRATENHQGYTNLDTFKFALHIDNNQNFYNELQTIFKEHLYFNDNQIILLIESFLKSKKSYVTSHEEDFYISLVDFKSLTYYYFQEYQTFKKEFILNEKLNIELQQGKDFYIFANYLRYFDKLNGNSYFVYHISFNIESDRPLTYKSKDLEYGYGNYPEQKIREVLTEIFGSLEGVNIKFNDHGYKQTQRELKDFIY